MILTLQNGWSSVINAQDTLKTEWILKVKSTTTRVSKWHHFFQQGLVRFENGALLESQIVECTQIIDRYIYLYSYTCHIY